MNAREIIARLRKGNPERRFAVYGEAESSVGYWGEGTARWVPCYGASIVCRQWIKLPGELLVNGRPCHDAAMWREVEDKKKED